jgi:PEP-CTERM motif-containing protein
VESIGVVGIEAAFYEYKTSFFVPANFALGTATLSGSYASFNELDDVRVNGLGELQAGQPDNAFAQLQPLPELPILNQLLLPGQLNTLSFLVDAVAEETVGDASFTNATGFRTQNLVLIYAATPEPASWILFAVGAAGLVGIGRRRKGDATLSWRAVSRL